MRDATDPARSAAEAILDEIEAEYGHLSQKRATVLTSRVLTAIKRASAEHGDHIRAVRELRKAAQPHRCPICLRSFVDTGAVDSHLKAKHPSAVLSSRFSEEARAVELLRRYRAFARAARPVLASIDNERAERVVGWLDALLFAETGTPNPNCQCDNDE